MTCSRCGCEQMGPAQFCRQCGQRMDLENGEATRTIAGQAAGAGAIPPYIAYAMQMARTRVRSNLQILSILWFLFGGLRVLTGLVAALSLHAVVSSGLFSFNDMPPFLPHVFRALIPIIGVVSVVHGALALLVGYGLHTRQTWGRTFAIVIGILELIKIPFGTALGIYTLWVLAPGASGEEWRRIQRMEPV